MTACQIRYLVKRLRYLCLKGSSNRNGHGERKIKLVLIKRTGS